MNVDPLLFPALVLGGYLLGSVSTAIVCCRALGRPDPRASGSGNPGATNVLRVAGRDAAALTLAGDLAKGALAVALARLLDAEPLTWALVGAAAFLGHVYPVYYRFRGGKGVATALGALLVGTPLAGVLTVLAWGIGFGLSRISSVGALTAFALAPLLVGLTSRQPELVAVTTAVALVLFWRHRSNIGNLLTGRGG